MTTFLTGIFCSEYTKLFENWVTKCINRISTGNDDDVVIVVWTDKQNEAFVKYVLSEQCKFTNHLILNGDVVSLPSIAINTILYIQRTINILYDDGYKDTNNHLFYLKQNVEFVHDIHLNSFINNDCYILSKGYVNNACYGGPVDKLFDLLVKVWETLYIYNFSRNQRVMVPRDFDNDAFTRCAYYFKTVDFQNSIYLNTAQEEIEHDIIFDFDEIEYSESHESVTCIVSIFTDQYITMLDHFIRKLFNKVQADNRKVLVIWTNAENVEYVHEVMKTYPNIEYHICICDILNGNDIIMHKSLYMLKTMYYLQELNYANPETSVWFFQSSSISRKEDTNLSKFKDKICFCLGWYYNDNWKKRSGQDLNQYYRVETKNVKKPACGWCWAIRGGFFGGNIKKMFDMSVTTHKWVQDDLNNHCAYPKWNDELYFTQYIGTANNKEFVEIYTLDMYFLDLHGKNKIVHNDTRTFNYLTQKNIVSKFHAN